MSKAHTNGKPPIRFAALIRVSTDKQEKKGESLRTQRTQIDQAVASVGGTLLPTPYGGSEHGTAGWEHKEVERLLGDAQLPRRPFDAVIVTDATRWSRDNVASKAGLETLKDSGVRFYVMTTEYDLYNPEARLFLGLSAEIGAYHAATQRKKSIENRIHRAKRGIPACGKLPWGRLYDKKTGEWSLDPIPLNST